MKYKAYINGQPYRMYRGSDRYSPNILGLSFCYIRIYVNDNTAGGVQVLVEGKEYTTSELGLVKAWVQRETLADNEVIKVTFNGETQEIYVEHWNLENTYVAANAHFTYDGEKAYIVLYIQQEGVGVGSGKVISVNGSSYTTNQSSFLYITGFENTTSQLTVTYLGLTETVQVVFVDGNQYTVDFPAVPEVEAGSKKWGIGDCGTVDGAVTQSFTVPAGVTKLQVYAKSDTSSSETTKYNSVIKNASNNVVWAEGYASKTPKHLEAVVAVTAGKTYDISMDCYWTSGVTISWSNEINAMAATVTDL